MIALATKKEKTKAERIRAEVNRLKRILKAAEVDENKFKLVEPLFERASFLRMTCEDLEAYLLEYGYTEPFQQSPNLPPYNKQRVEATLMFQANKDYKTIMKQIADILDVKASVIKDDGFDEWNRGN